MRFTGFALFAFLTAVVAQPTSKYDDYMTTTGSSKLLSCSKVTLIMSSIKGFVPGTKHGLHVHEIGDLSGGCDTLGLHFNPFNQNHSSPFVKVRHVADFGNIEQEDHDLKISTLKLYVKTTIIGRGLVFYFGEMIGSSDSPFSKTVGNSGGILARGIVGICEGVGNTTQIQAVIDNGITGPLIHALAHGDLKSKKEACWAICNATSGGLNKPDQIKYLVNEGCIKPLCDILTSMDNKIILVALDGLDSILKVGDMEKVNTMDGVNPYIMIEEFGGVEYIHASQDHDNIDVYRNHIN